MLVKINKDIEDKILEDNNISSKYTVVVYYHKNNYEVYIYDNIILSRIISYKNNYIRNLILKQKLKLLI